MTPNDRRCLLDGAYCRDERTGILYRCLGERLQEEPGEHMRVGYEDVLDPDEVRWVSRGNVFAHSLRFVCQGEPSSQREIVEAMR